MLVLTNTGGSGDGGDGGSEWQSPIVIESGPVRKRSDVGRESSSNRVLFMAAQTLLRMRQAGAVGDFPPAYLGEERFKPIGTLEGREERLQTYYDWLGSGYAYRDTGEIMGRWVAWDSVSGLAVGHVEVAMPAEYLVDGFSEMTFTGSRIDLSLMIELGRLFVDPEFRHFGIGSQLVTTATNFIVEQGFVPVLVVLDSAVAAVRLYETMGWVELGGFVGVQGRNVVYVFPDR